MNTPLFFAEGTDLRTGTVVLNEQSSKHAVQVLRMKAGEQLKLVNGKGILAHAVIVRPDKRNMEVRVEDISVSKRQEPKISIAISPVKNASRFEWFLEKATEIGIDEIIPLLCERTERQTYRYERLHQVLISAMLQSKQTWLPLLCNPVHFMTDLPGILKNYPKKFIAHCAENKKQQLNTLLHTVSDESVLMLIGPEGDFTSAEIAFAEHMEFTAAALGHTRLRTETAGIVAAALLKLQR